MMQPLNKHLPNKKSKKTFLANDLKSIYKQSRAKNCQNSKKAENLVKGLSAL